MIESSVNNPPYQASAESSLADWPQAPVATPRKYGILIADDEGSVRDRLNVGMRRQGFAVWLAGNGQEALDLYRRHRETIDVVLLDVCMPGLDGLETLFALQELNPQICCCFMSGTVGRHTEERLCKWSAAAVVPKPFSLAEVAQVLLELASKADLTCPASRAAQQPTWPAHTLKRERGRV
jgi:CheY-like chemotaxis protein